MLKQRSDRRKLISRDEEYFAKEVEESKERISEVLNLFNQTKATFKVPSTKLREYTEGSKSASRVPELKSLKPSATHHDTTLKMSARSSNTVSRNEGQISHRHHKTHHVIQTSRHSVGDKSDLGHSQNGRYVGDPKTARSGSRQPELKAEPTLDAAMS